MTSDMKKTFLIVVIVLYFTATINGNPNQHFRKSLKRQKSSNETKIGSSFRSATVTYKLYLGGINNFEKQIRQPNSAPLRFKHLNPNLPIVVIIPTPFSEKIVIEFKQAMLNAYDRGRYNLISIDWTYSGTNSIYGGIAAGKLAALGIRDMYQRGLHFDRIISYSTGAIVLSTAAVYCSACRIPRIVALDPKKKIFQIPHELRLSKRSADLVEVVHTSFGAGGINKKLGHRDFFPNGGISPQPGCTNEYGGECSSKKAFIWYAKALNDRNRRKYRARFCPNYSDFVAKRCTNNPTVYLNNYKSKNEVPHGKYYLDTTIDSWV